jgi:hypothetical protein
MTVGALSAPVAVAIADTNSDTDVQYPITGSNHGAHKSVSDRATVKHAAMRADVRREAAPVLKHRAKKHKRKLARKHAATAGGAPQASAPGASTAGGGSTASAPLQAIAACESGGNPSAIGGGGQFRGKYQFTYSTWAAVGGSGDPAAASEAEQDQRAAALYSSAGAGQWPVCGQ